MLQLYLLNLLANYHKEGQYFLQIVSHRFLFIHYYYVMNTLNQLSRTIINLRLSHAVSNISEKKFVYSFEVGSHRIVHPMRTITDGTDRILVTPNLIAISDHGNGQLDNAFSDSIDHYYSEKLLKVIELFYSNQPLKYTQHPTKLVKEAVESIKQSGATTLTLALVHPETGEVSFYYIGDSLYGIFKEKQVVMVEGLYQSFNLAYKVGKEDYPAQNGFQQKYSYADIKNELILAASNGVWNNVNLQLLHYQIRGPNSYVSRKGEDRVEIERQPKSLQAIAEKVCRIAAHCSKMGDYESPYFKTAMKSGVEVPKEGYLDDISLILARVKRSIAIK